MTEVDVNLDPPEEILCDECGSILTPDGCPLCDAAFTVEQAEKEIPELESRLRELYTLQARLNALKKFVALGKHLCGEATK